MSNDLVSIVIPVYNKQSNFRNYKNYSKSNI